MPQSPMAVLTGRTPANLPASLKLNAVGELLVDDGGLKYVTCAASGTQVLGTGAVGDVLNGLLIVPGAAAAGVVGIKDGGGSTISIFAGGGTTALVDLKPFFVPLNAISAAGAWSVVLGANITAIAIGQFTP